MDFARHFESWRFPQTVVEFVLDDLKLFVRQCIDAGVFARTGSGSLPWGFK